MWVIIKDDVIEELKKVMEFIPETPEGWGQAIEKYIIEDLEEINNGIDEEV